MYISSLESLLMTGVSQKLFPSAAAAFGFHETVLAKCFVGNAPKESDMPVDENTLYDMASVTKIISTTMLTLRAIEDGIFGLNSRIGEFLDVPDDKKSITIEMLLSHTSGLIPNLPLSKLLSSPKDTLRYIISYPLQCTPGTEMHYSCIGFILLGYILETVYALPLDILSRERIFSPLGMNKTCFCPSDGTCAATTSFETGLPLVGTVHDNNARFLGGVSGNAGVFMPLSDAIIFAQMLSNKGKGLILESTMRNAINNYSPGQSMHRGLGFELAGSPGCFMGNNLPNTAFGHTGFSGTSIVAEPESGFWAVLLTNSVYYKTKLRNFSFRADFHNACWATFCKGQIIN